MPNGKEFVKYPTAVAAVAAQVSNNLPFCTSLV